VGRAPLNALDVTGKAPRASTARWRPGADDDCLGGTDKEESHEGKTTFKVA